MSAKQKLQALMREIGPRLELQEVTEFDERDAWSLVVDEDATVILFADYEPGQDRLVLSAEVAEAPEEDRLGLYERMLRYNSLWRETGGVRLALAGSGIVQLFELPVAGLDLERLQGVITGFAAALKGWREIVARSAERGSGADQPFSPSMVGMIRG